MADQSDTETEREYSDARCTCDEPVVKRTMAKGTPAQREYCECGGYIP